LCFEDAAHLKQKRKKQKPQKKTKKAKVPKTKQKKEENLTLQHFNIISKLLLYSFFMYLNFPI
jgi:hypothetical protein